MNVPACPAEMEATNMAKYVCTVCGYIYDEAKGSPENGIDPGTTWDKVPEDFTCPGCGVDKSMFELQ